MTDDFQFEDITAPDLKPIERPKRGPKKGTKRGPRKTEPMVEVAQLVKQEMNAPRPVDPLGVLNQVTDLLTSLTPKQQAQVMDILRRVLFK